ncbi:MAG TPA: hypothetical protein VGG75_29935 [Trebonia sp.]|jgi:hypothetical protein
MTAESFDRLLYTDCKPGTGRGAGGGFQVQAQSSGVDAAQSKLAVSGLLYEVQLPWINQDRAVGDFPPGLAHVSGEGFGTGQSRYVGKTALGSRDGNHLADCLLTRDPALYGVLRPAQLWQAGFWRDIAWEGKDCPQFDAAELEPGPLAVDVIADWVRSAPGRKEVLTRLVSLLENPGGRRVVIVSASADDAVRWIAAATLLLPARRALDVSFKVFSAAPLDARHRIVAAPADLYPKIVPGSGGQRFVIDARDNRCDEAEVSQRAAFFASRFAGDEDPYDVADAVELTDTLGGGHDAMLTAWALTSPDDPRTEPSALFRWLSAAGPDALAGYGTEVTGLLLADGSDASTLRWIDAAVSAGRLDADAAAVRVFLLTAELMEADGGGKAPPDEVLPVVELDRGARRDAESGLSSALLLGSDQKADTILCLARRHGIAPELAPPLQQRLRDFASGWLSNPGRYHPDSWALKPEILDCAYDELRHRVTIDGADAVLPVLGRLNRYFADRADVTDPLDRTIQAGLIARTHDTDQVRRLLAAIARSPAPAEAAAGLQRALLQRDAVDGGVAVAILTDLPGSCAVEPAIAHKAADTLARGAARPSRTLLDQLAALDAKDRMPKSRELAGLAAEDRRILAFGLRATAAEAKTSREFFDDTVSLLLDSPAAVIEARVGDIVTSLVASQDARLAATVLRQLRTEVTRGILGHWAGTLGARDPVADGTWYVRCVRADAFPPKLRDQLSARVRQYARKLSQQDYERWYQDVSRSLRPELRPVWESVFTREDDEDPRSWLWSSRDGGRR